MFRITDSKSPDTILQEWDALAPVRFRQISSGDDVTYCHILVPRILALISAHRADTILDAGCGVGFLTERLAEHASQVIGIDPSRKSIEIAREHYGERVEFLVETLESYSSDHPSSVDLVVANMVLMDVLDLDGFLSAAYKVLQPSGTLVFSATHPCFWPSYYGYESEPWFRYERPTIIEGPFKITAQPDCPLLSTHVHRPLGSYVQAIHAASFSIESLQEPMPSPQINARYPAPWVYPRYLIGLCRRAGIAP